MQHAQLQHAGRRSVGQSGPGLREYPDSLQIVGRNLKVG
jgi:hypothetical protein